MSSIIPPIFDLRKALADAHAAGDWLLARRLIHKLENECNQRADNQERRAMERRFTGELPSAFAALQ